MEDKCPRWKMRNIFSFDCRENVRHVVKKVLKEDFGIKVPKEKAVKLQVCLILRNIVGR